MRGIILHGGAGTRLRPLTFSGPKQLIPVANKPVSQYVLEDLVSCGITEIAIILGEIYPSMVSEYYSNGSRFGCKICYIYQGKPLGIAHAISLAEEFVGDDNFVVYLGDNLLQYGIKEYLNRFIKGDYDAFILLKDVDDPRMFGVAKFDTNGKLIGLIEKPETPPSKYAVIGVYMFKPVIFDVIREIKPSWRGEYEITDTIQLMLNKGFKVGYEVVKGWWFDTGKASDILKINATILDERARMNILGEIVNSNIEGRVEIGDGTKILNSIVRGPAIIGRNCIIENSFIGPYTSIGENVKIIDSSIEYSVILSGSLIKGIERLEESLIGRYAKIHRESGNRRVLRLNISDYSEVKL